MKMHISQLKISPLKKAINALILGLLIFEICIPPMYLGSILLNGKPYPPLDMDKDLTIASLLQAFLLFLNGLIALLLFIFDRYSRDRPSNGFKLIIAFCFFYAVIDEIFKIHLQFHHWFPGLNTRYWMAGYLSIIFMLPVIFYKDIITLWHNYRQATILAFSGSVIFVIGGFGSEIFKHYILQPILVNLFQNQRRFLPLMLEKIRVSVEEYSEMLGETLILYGILLFVIKKLEKYHWTQTNSPESTRN